MKVLSTLLFFASTFSFARAQSVLITHSYPPAQLVNDILKGSGLTLSNITYTGAHDQIGYFSQGDSMGFENGVLLTTGDVQIAVGPNNAMDASFVAGVPGDSDLELSIGATAGTSYDACVLEFDMIAIGTEVSLKYVFASEEYPEYVCSQFNDAFAFFITGPGYTPNTNVALIPGTSTNVGINSVNGGSVGLNGTPGGCVSLANSALYRDNTSGFAIQYDAFTVPLTAKMSVVPNATYHVKLVIADMFDDVLDSGIFLKENSLTTNFFPVTVSICAGDSLFAGGAWHSTNGTYIDTLTAVNGSDSIVATTLHVVNSLVSASVSICQGDSFYASGDWQTSAGIYTDTFVSSLGCDSIVSLHLSVVQSITVSLDNFICTGDSVFAGGGWQTASGIFSDTFIASGGCDSIVITTLTVDSNLVWPGDANHDFIADNSDLLSIGLYFGESGYARDSLSYIWQGHCAQDWSTVQSNGSNKKHADCNGDGLIGSTDTLALNINYTLVHAKGEGFRPSGVGPLLTVVPRKGTYLPGDTVLLDIVLGDNSTPVNELYGIAFNITFDHTMAEAGTARLYYPDSWLGNISNNLKLSKIFESNGKADGALTRIDHQNAAGYGGICVLQFIANSNLNSLQTSTVSINGYAAVNANADAITFNAQDGTFTIDGTNGIKETANELTSFSIFPNPFTSVTNIEFSLKQDAGVSLKIYDVLGKVVMEKSESIYPQGIYKVQFENNTAAKGLFIAELNVNGVKIRKRLVEIQ